MRRSRWLLFSPALVLAAWFAGDAAAHGSIDEEIAILDREIAARPGEASLYAARGELHRVHRDWPRALADLERAARLDPADADIDLYHGRMLLDAGHPAAAERVLARRNTG